MNQKITDTTAQAMAEAHADGISFRALARLYDVAPSLVHRHVTRVTADPLRNGYAPELAPEPVETGAAVERPIESEPDTGASEPDARPGRQHPETEFPAVVAGFEPDDEPAEPAIIFELSPAEQSAARRCAAADRRAREDERRELEREAVLIAREEELLATARAAKPGTEEWTQARRALKRFRDGRRRFLPLASATGVKVSEQTLRDGPPPALWDNPHGP